MGGFLANFLKTTNFVVKVDNKVVVTEFDWNFSLGFRAGAGVLINDKSSIALDYYGIGEHDIHGTMIYGNSSDLFDYKQKVGLLTLTFGFKL